MQHNTMRAKLSWQRFCILVGGAANCPRKDLKKIRWGADFHRRVAMDPLDRQGHEVL